MSVGQGFESLWPPATSSVLVPSWVMPCSQLPDLAACCQAFLYHHGLPLWNHMTTLGPNGIHEARLKYTSPSPALPVRTLSLPETTHLEGMRQEMTTLFAQVPQLTSASLDHLKVMVIRPVSPASSPATHQNRNPWYKRQSHGHTSSLHTRQMSLLKPITTHCLQQEAHQYSCVTSVYLGKVSAR